MLVFKPLENFLLLLPPKIFTTTTNPKPHLLHLHLHHHHHHVKLHFSPLKANFKSTTLSSSTLSPPPPPPSDSSSLTATAADFLMDSCGLSYGEAIQVIIHEVPSLSNNGSRKPRSVIAYFESIGFSKTTHISKVISKCPRLLVSDVENTFKPKIQLFLDFGFSYSDIADLIALQPSILLRSLQNQIKPGLELIKSFVKTDEDLIKVIMNKNNALLLRSIHHRNTIQPNIDVLRHQGVPDSEILHLILTRLDALMSTPKLFKTVVKRIVTLGFKPETRKFLTAVVTMCRMNRASWDSKMDLLKGLGWSDEQILDAFRRLPKFLTLSRENLQESIEFYVENMNWDASILSQYPVFLNLSLKRRVIPRLAVLKCLMSKEIIKKDTLVFIAMLRLTETQFLSRYVFKYQQQLPYLYEVYNKEDNGEITNQQDNGDIDMTVNRTPQDNG